MKKTLILLFFSSFAASTTNICAQNLRLQAPPGYNYIYTEDFPKETDGSPYLDDWQPADVFLKNGKSILALPMRYDVYNNKMIYKYNNKTYSIGAPDSISEIKFPNRVFVYKQKGTKNEKSYFEKLVNGKVCLFNQYEIKIIQPTYNVALNVGNKNSRLALKEHLYIEQENALIMLSKKNQLIDILIDKQQKVTDYMNTENLSYKEKDDVIKIISYYNQLQ
jgi:hypothetical protein